MTIPDFPLVLFLLFLSNVDAAPSPPDTWNNVQRILPVSSQKLAHN